MIAIDLETALGADGYVDRLEELVRRLAALEVNPLAEPARYPGERRWKLRHERLRDGIPLAESDVADVMSLARSLGVAVD
jgi:LDH2 family malate/lactate/ureidoglycolate dehydrogenase